MQRLIVLTSSSFIENEVFWIRALFDLGLDCLHVRKPNQSVQKVQELLLMIPSEFYSKIVIHHHWSLHDIIQYGGIHGSIEKHHQKKWNKVRSVPCHSIEEWLELPDYVSYCFLSPIFNSISKTGLKANLDLLKVKEFFLEEKYGNRLKPIFALGGIDENTIETCFNLGFQGVAVLGVIWGQKDPLCSFLRIQQKIKEVYGE